MLHKHWCTTITGHRKTDPIRVRKWRNRVTYNGPSYDGSLVQNLRLTIPAVGSPRETEEVEFLRPVAAYPVVGTDLFKRGGIDPALINGIAAARVEIAARRRISGIGDLTFQHKSCRFYPRVWNRHRL